jgi:hypothetical protein
VPVSSLVRLSGWPATEPFWACSADHRFDDPQTGAANEFGVCYAGDSLEVAFAESVIHDGSLFVDGRFAVSDAELKRRQMVTFRHPSRADLVLADLTGFGLKAIGLTNDISAGGDYTVPQLWAQAIHRADPKWDGIRYVSRQHNHGFAFAIFDRSGIVRDSHQAMDAATLDRLCEKFYVDII